MRLVQSMLAKRKEMKQDALRHTRGASIRMNICDTLGHHYPEDSWVQLTKRSSVVTPRRGGDQHERKMRGLSPMGFDGATGRACRG
jgi:hypothetical protein